MKKILLIFCILGICAIAWKLGPWSNKTTTMNDSKIFKIFNPLQWEDFKITGVFHGNDLDINDGFIHLSFADQWQDIWHKFFNKAEVYLVQLCNLDSQFLKIEANKPGGTKYPHYYGGSLSNQNIKEVTKISVG